jgi:hypothetical protein
MNDWRIDEDGSLRTPAGMKVGRLTQEGDFEVMDRVIHEPVSLGLLALLRLWRAWRRLTP